MKTEEGFKVINMLANDFGLTGSQEYQDYINDPSAENAAKFQKALQINYKQ